jgi:hypothetical protein
MLAALRPHPVDLPLFLHIVGATMLFGALVTVAMLAVVARRRPGPERLARAAFGILLALAVPAWVLMYTAGSWTKSKEHLPDTVHWIQVPRSIGDSGFVVLLLLTGIAFSWSRRPGGSWQARSLVVLSALYLAALGVAWWVMTAKPSL